MRSLSRPDRLRLVALEVTELLYKQQKLWKFQENKNYHAFWDLPKCTCPRMDNQDRYGTPYAIYDTECPIHASITS